MKKILILLLMTVPLFGLARDNKYVLSGKIGKWNSPASVMISYMYDGKIYQIDTATLKNGRFSFTADIQGPTYVRLAIDYTGKNFGHALRDTKNAYFFYVDLETVKLESKDSLQNAVVRSPINGEYQAYLKEIKYSVMDIQNIVEAERLSVTLEQRRNPAFIKALNVMYDSLYAERAQRQIAYAKRYPDSYFSIAALCDVFGLKPKLDQSAPLFNALSERVRNTREGKDFDQKLKIAEATVIGVPAPDFTLNDVNGKPVKLSDFRGQYVLLDFWGSWCHTCRMDNPYLVKAYEKYKDKGFTIIGIASERGGKTDAWLAAVEKDGLIWTNVVDWQPANKVVNLYGVYGVPRKFLIDPQGMIIDKDIKGKDLDARLEKILEKK